MVFLTLGLAQLGVALAVRAPRRPGSANPWLGAAVALSVMLMMAGAYAYPLQSLLGTSALRLDELVICVVAAVVPGAVMSAARAVRHERRPAVCP
jgi:Ca2+-transporting ATPase